MIRRSPIRIARDYNGALWPPVRWLHIAWAAAVRPMAEFLGWVMDPSRRYWAAPLLLAAAGVPLVLPRDPAIRDALLAVFSHVGGDIRREIEAWQQYGGVGSIIICLLVIVSLDAGRLRRFPDMALAIGLTSLATLGLKLFFGRPRPKYDDPFMFLWPGGQYPIVRDGKPVMASALDSISKSELWSMPSSHTSGAAALTVVLVALYPRLRWLAIGLVGVVMIGRSMVGNPPAHWPSDVLAGACLGWLVAGTVMRHSLGCRLVDRLRNRRARKHAAIPLTWPASPLSPPRTLSIGTRSDEAIVR